MQNDHAERALLFMANKEIRIQANGKKHGKNALSFLFNGGGSSKVTHKKTSKKKGKRPGHNPMRPKHHAGKRPGRNPFRPERGGMSGDVATVIGAVSASVIPDLIETSLLTQWNSGFMGYVADAVLGGAIMFVGGKFIGRDFAKGAVAGVAVKISIRALQDVGSSPHNAIAANVRDAQANQASNAAPAGAPPAMGAPKAYRFQPPPSYPMLPGGGYGTTPTMGRPVPVRRAAEVRARY